MAELVIRISGDIKNYKEALDKAQQETEGLGEGLAKVTQVSAIAFAALTAEVYLATKAFAEAEATSNKLQASLQNQGLASAELTLNYKKQAEQIQALTGIDDDLVTSGQAVLQNLIGQTKITPELTKAAVDLAAATGTDLNTAFEIVGRGIQGNVRGFKQYGIEIDDAASKADRTSEIIEKLTQKFGGQAEAQAKGLGSLKGVTTAFGNLQEAIGERLAPAIEFVATKLTAFLNFLSQNKAVADLATSLLVAGTALAGIVTIVGAAGTAFLALRAALAAANIQIGATSLAVRGLIGATGIGLLLIIITEIALNWNTIWPRMQAVFAAFANNISSLLGGIGNLLAGVFTFDIGKIKEGLATVKDTLKKGFADATQDISITPEVTTQDDNKKKLADAAAAEEKRRDDARIAARKANNEALFLEANRGSAELIALKKQEAQLLDQIRQEDNAENRAAIQQKIDDTKLLEQQAYADQFEQRQVFSQEILAQNEEFEALSDEQKAAFLAKNQANFQNQILTERQARQQAAQDKLDIQVKEHNTFLLNQAKFGTAYATINQILNSAIVQGSAKAFGELAALQTSSNATLKGIGKVAATANIIIKTAESAINIYAGFSAIPIIGPALGIAGAAAAVAFGAEQIGKVNAAADGGLLTGGIPGVDSIPVLAQAGELVVPRQNFEEVVSAVANQRGGGNQDQGGGGGTREIVLRFIPEKFMDFIELESAQREALNISLKGG